MPSTGLNLTSVNEAFGEKADLYTDVLGIKPNASTDQIQQAYFARRDELFHVLAQMDQRGVDANSQKRFNVERQMDGVVMALRVLGDPDARMRYDSIREERMGVVQEPGQIYPGNEVPLGTGTSLSTSTSGEAIPVPRRPPKLKSALKTSKSMDEQHHHRTNLGELSATVANTRSVDFVDETKDNGADADSDSTPEGPRLMNKGASRSAAVRSKAVGQENLDGRQLRKTRSAPEPKRRDDDEASLGSVGTLGTTLSILESRRGFFQVVKDEVMGAIDDTSRSVEQVFNVFTLQEDEINAVFGRIDKAKRQMENEFTPTPASS
mmetsp:Transcript_20896/g.45342  ORF Transcript_20896/g.45342 Transcript_20896/m.45342 type:complete len:322 (-) Transcript_20896:243-1208(-)